MFDVAVIGAGMAGLVCAQQLRLAGYRVVVIEKSRGLGGRVATRRLYGTCADRGLRYLQAEGLLESFIKILGDRQILQVWTDTVYLKCQMNAPATYEVLAVGRYAEMLEVPSNFAYLMKCDQPIKA